MNYGPASLQIDQASIQRENGVVIFGRFSIGDLHFTWKRGGRSGTLMLELPGKPLPYHMTSPTWEHAQAKAQAEVATFRAGRVPKDGLYRPVERLAKGPIMPLLVVLLKGPKGKGEPSGYLTNDDGNVFPVYDHKYTPKDTARHREIVQKIHDNTKDPEKKAKHAEYLEQLSGNDKPRQPHELTRSEYLDQRAQEAHQEDIGKVQKQLEQHRADLDSHKRYIERHADMIHANEKRVYAKQTRDKERLIQETEQRLADASNPDRLAMWRKGFEGDSSHRHQVDMALATGKAVPEQVLDDYPDLVAKHGKGKVEAATAPKKQPHEMRFTEMLDAWHQTNNEKIEALRSRESALMG